MNRRQEVNFLVHCFRRYARRRVHSVLDIACGTGPHLIRLGRAGLRHVGARPLAPEHRVPPRARRRQGARDRPAGRRHDALQAQAPGGRRDLHAGLAGSPAHERGAARPPALRGAEPQEGRALRLRPLHVLVVDRSGAALVVDASPGPGHRPRHLRGAQGPEPGHPDVLRGHGARGPRGRRAPGLSPAPRLADGLPAGASRRSSSWPAASTWSSGSTASSPTSASIRLTTRC